MKDNRERILRFLSGLEDERKFLSELNSNPELKNEYEKIKGELSLLDETPSIDINENYYSSITPKLREKLAEKKKSSSLRRYVYGLSTTAVVIVLFYTFQFMFRSSQSSFDILSDLLEDHQYSEVLEELENSYSSEDYIQTISFSDDYLQTFTTEESNYVQNYELPGVSSLYDNDYIEYISEDQLNEIINKLEDKEYF